MHRSHLAVVNLLYLLHICVVSWAGPPLPEDDDGGEDDDDQEHEEDDHDQEGGVGGGGVDDAGGRGRRVDRGGAVVEKLSF